MRFNEKLNLLMKMSNTTNMLLAEALGIDPSLVSRWRTGSREPNFHSRYIISIGAYFASIAKQDFQRVALLELTGHTFEEKDVAEPIIANYVTRWLTNDSKITGETIQTLLDTISQATMAENRQTHHLELPQEPSGTSVLSQTFHGTGGLQEAVTKLLLRTLSAGQQSVLLLYSDESMDWINSYPAFARMWSYLLVQCIRKGTKIKIIHTLARDSSELAGAVEKWLPFYLTGAITSYYYPRKLDGLFRHTHFILQGQAAVSSVSVKHQEKATIAYHFSADPIQVDAMQKLFNAELDQCKPLVRTFIGKAISNVNTQRLAFLSMPGSYAANLEILPTTGMPTHLLEQMLIRNNVPLDERIAIVEKAKEYDKIVIQILQKQDYLFLICLPRINDVLKGNVKAGAVELYVRRPCNYLPQEYLEHLRHTIELLKHNDRLQLCIIAKKYMIPNVQAFAKPGAGMVVLKLNEPIFAFISEQRDLVSALYRHFTVQAQKLPKRERNKEFVLNRLENFATRIESGMAKNDS